MIWAAGVDRRLPLETSLGFHQPSNQAGSASVEGIRRVEAYLRFLGYSEDTVRFAVGMPPQSMAWVMNVTQAEKVGLVVVNDPVKQRDGVRLGTLPVEGQVSPFLHHFRANIKTCPGLWARSAHC